MSDPFDYRDPTGQRLELDLPSAPLPRPAGKAPAKPHAEDLSELPEAWQELPEELTAPFADAAPERPESEAWALELEDIPPPVATPSLASAPRAQASVRVAAAQLRLPQPSAAPVPLPVRTLELRIAQSVDRMSPITRVGLLTLTVVTMLLLATSVLVGGVRSAIETLEQLRGGALAAEPMPTAPGPHGGYGQPTGADPYGAYRVDDVVDVDDDGRHGPQH